MVSESLRRRVKQIQARSAFPTGIKHAVEIARYEDTEPQYAFLSELFYADDVAKGRIGDLEVIVKVEYDEDSQLGEDDVTGTFTDKESENTIPNAYAGHRVGNGCYGKFYQPSNYDITELPKDMARWGVSRGNLPLLYRAILEERMRDDHDRTYYGVTASVRLDGNEIGGASLWGIDSLPDAASEVYIRETAAELVSEALENAKHNLPRAIESSEATLTKLRALQEGQQ